MIFMGPEPNQNFSGFASLHNFPVGIETNNHWGDAVTALETTSGTPYWFNFHERDVGNFTMFGPTGYGKTVLLTFLHAQSQKFNPKSIYFDKDRGAEIYLRAVGAEYNIVRSGVASGLNPLQLEDTPENRAFLRSWLQILIKGDRQKEFTAKELDIIADAVNANYDAPKQHRRLSILAKLFGGFDNSEGETLAERLSMWHSNGERAWMFDNETDNLSLEHQTIGFDMTSVLDDPLTRTPWLYYIFHRIQNALDGQKAMIMLDEGWKLLDDPAFSTNIKNWLKTVRKQNGLVGFATQSISDAVNSAVGETILEQCPKFTPINTVTRYLHTDHLGTPRIASDTSGASVWDWTSNAYGVGIPTGSATINLRFAGQYYDDESGLHYNWNRYYDPTTGRYISSDPIGLNGGLNTFAYVTANPVMFTDPEGLVKWTGNLAAVSFMPGFGITTFSYDLISDCDIEGKKVRVSGLAVLFGLAVGFDFGFSSGEIVFYDNNYIADPYVFNGIVIFGGGGAGISNDDGLSESFGWIGMGRARALYSGRVKGTQFELGMSGSFGLSTINPFTIRETSCSCSL